MRHAADTDIATIVEEHLTDGSKAQNVLLNADGARIVLACLNEAHAETLSEALNEASWVEHQEPFVKQAAAELLAALMQAREGLRCKARREGPGCGDCWGCETMRIADAAITHARRG